MRKRKRKKDNMNSGHFWRQIKTTTKVILLYMTIKFFASCQHPLDLQKKTILETHGDTSGILLADVNSDSILTRLDCDDRDADLKINRLERQIDSLLLDTRNYLFRSKLKRDVVFQVLAAVDEERKRYKLDIETRAELVHRSFGVALVTDERVTAKNCFLLSELNERFLFYVAITDRIKGNMPEN